MKIRIQLTSIVLALGVLGQAHAAPVNVFTGTVAAGNQLITFGEVSGGAAPGTNYNNVLTIGNASFAERFAGQSLGVSGNFDVLSGTPTGPLTLAAGAAGANLAVATFGATSLVVGVGPGLYPNISALGPGAFSALFSIDQSELGFDILGTNGGVGTVNFFRRDGTLIQSLLLALNTDTSWTFRREGALLDIAGFSITNNDSGGVGYTNLRFNLGTQPPIGAPEPGTLALAGLALAGALALRRKVAA